MRAPLPNLPALIDRSSARLVAARSSAEVLEAKAIAEAALHYAKVTKAANDTHADCLRIITRAEMRMANEIDAGQKRGEIARGRPKESVQTSDSLGLDRRRVAEWREVRDAGDEVVEETIQTALAEGRAPTKAEILDAAKERAGKRKRYVGRPFEEESQHDRDLRMLKGVWDGACETAQRAFLDWVSAPSDLPPHDPETGEIIESAPVKSSRTPDRATEAEAESRKDPLSVGASATNFVSFEAAASETAARSPNLSFDRDALRDCAPVKRPQGAGPLGSEPRGLLPAAVHSRQPHDEGAGTNSEIGEGRTATLRNTLSAPLVAAEGDRGDGGAAATVIPFDPNDKEDVRNSFLARA